MYRPIGRQPKELCRLHEVALVTSQDNLLWLTVREPIKIAQTLFTGSLLRTLIYTIAVVTIELVLGLAIAVLFTREIPGIRLVRTLYLRRC